MLDPKELRLGNLVQDKKDGTTTVIMVAHLNEGLVNYWDKSVYQPIHISEEWLKRIGAESIGELHPTYKLRNFLIEATLMRDGYNLRQIINADYSLHLCRVDYVHTLQNAWFALTGSELTINL